jgi:hypothetical protein
MAAIHLVIGTSKLVSQIEAAWSHECQWFLYSGVVKGTRESGSSTWVEYTGTAAKLGTELGGHRHEAIRAAMRSVDRTLCLMIGATLET